MEYSLIEQAAALIEPSRAPVIIIPNHPSSDAIAASLGLLLVLEKTGRRTKIVCSEFTLPASHSFLPKSASIEKELTNLQKFVIRVDTKNSPLESLSYDLEGDELRIYLTPKNGFYEAKNVQTTSGGYAHDAIITIEVEDVKALGALHDNNPDFFYHTPILNIDHRATNTRFGHVNLVDVVASSASEIIFELIRKMGFENLDEQVATSLLTGIISKTKVFQSHVVTPRSLAVASHLITSGARRDEIIRNLYQTKTLNTLQLWGRALTRLKTSEDKQVVWATVLRGDWQHLQAKPSDAVGVLDELMVNAPEANYTVLFVEADKGVDVHIAHRANQSLPTLPATLVSQSPEYISGRLPEDLTRTQASILKALGVITKNTTTHNNGATAKP